MAGRVTPTELVLNREMIAFAFLRGEWVLCKGDAVPDPPLSDGTRVTSSPGCILGFRPEGPKGGLSERQPGGRWKIDFDLQSCPTQKSILTAHNLCVIRGSAEVRTGSFAGGRTGRERAPCRASLRCAGTAW